MNEDGIIMPVPVVVVVAVVAMTVTTMMMKHVGSTILPHHIVKPKCLFTNFLQIRVIKSLENAKLEVGKNRGPGGQSSLHTLYLNWHM